MCISNANSVGQELYVFCADDDEKMPWAGYQNMFGDRNDAPLNLYLDSPEVPVVRQIKANQRMSWNLSIFITL